MTLSGLERMGPTVGRQLTPVALGGAFYDHANLRLAHRSCNAKGGRGRERVELLAIQGAARWLRERLTEGVNESLSVQPAKTPHSFPCV